MEKDNDMDSPSASSEEMLRRRKLRKRVRRIFPENNSSSEADGEDTEMTPAKRGRLVTEKAKCQDGESSVSRLDLLQKQVETLTKLITKKSDFTGDSSSPQSPTVSMDCNYSIFDETFVNVAKENSVSDKCDFTFCDFDTTLMGSSLPKTVPERLKEIEKLQHFDSSDWTNVRYADIQKKYVSTPGGTSLESNDILKQFEEKEVLLKSLDQTFATLTNMLLTQRESLQLAMKEFLTWTNDKNTSLSAMSVTTKIRELFSDNSNLRVVSKDLMQVVCGRRADILQQRRDKLLSHVKDKYNRMILKKIPPTSEFLFRPSALDDAIAKLGGNAKVFFKRPYPPAEGGQVLPGRSSDPMVKKPFQGNTSTASANSRQRESAKGKSLAGKRPYATAKNLKYRRDRDDFERRKRQ